MFLRASVSLSLLQLEDEELDVGHLVDLDVLPLPDGYTVQPTGQQLMEVGQVLLNSLCGRCSSRTSHQVQKC